MIGLTKMPRIDCGIDIGSTNLKVVLVTEETQVLHACAIPTPRADDGLGPVTDALGLVAFLEDMIIEGWNKVGQGAPLRSIAASGVGEDGVAVTADLTPTGFALPWFDDRAQEEAEFLRRYRDLSRTAGIALGPDRTAAKWLWTHRHRPDELERAATWIALTDFPAAWWAGRAFMSASLAPRTACFDVHRRRWITELMTVTHAPALPDILGAGTIVGTVSKGRLLTSGAACDQTIVVAGGHDHPVAASVIRRFDPTGIVDSLGTANLIYGESGRIGVPAPDRRLALSLPPDAGDGLAVLGVLELSAALQAVEAGTADVRSYLSNQTLPGQPPQDIAELDQPQTSLDMRIRHVLEGESLRARAILDDMASLGVPSGAIYCTGGWARSHGLMELRASVFGQPVNVIDDMELSAFGAAQFGAKAATGRFTCTISNDDIKCVRPSSDWAAQYEALYGKGGASMRVAQS